MARMNKRDFKMSVAVGKGVRDLAQGAGLAAIGGLVAYFSGLDAEALKNMEIPVWAIPAALGVFATLRNVIRNKFGMPV